MVEPDVVKELSQATRSIGHATDNVAASVAKAGTNGLKGILANNIGNLTAVGVICCLVVYLVRETASNAREDRMMFREELKELRSSRDLQTEKIVDKLESVRSSIEINTKTIERIGRDAKDDFKKVKTGLFVGPISPDPKNGNGS